MEMLMVMLVMPVLPQCHGLFGGQLDEMQLPCRTNCSEYIQHGKLETCPEGRKFDFIKFRCVPAEEAVCVDRSSKLTAEVIRKCCHANESFSGISNRCEKSETTWMPIHHWWNPDNQSYPVKLPFYAYHVSIGLMNASVCDLKFINVGQDQAEHPIELHLLTDGWLFVPEYNTKYAPQVYCVDQMVVGERTILAGTVCEGFNPKYMYQVEGDRTVVPRCCPHQHAIRMKPQVAAECHYEQNSTFRLPPFIQQGKVTVEQDDIYRHVQYRLGLPDGCIDGTKMLDPMLEPFSITNEGALKLINRNVSIDSKSYCINERQLTALSGEIVFKMYALVCANILIAIRDPKIQDKGRGIRKCCPIGHSLMFLQTEGEGTTADSVIDANDKPPNSLAWSHVLDSSLQNAEVRYGTPYSPLDITKLQESFFVNSEGRLEIFSSDGCKFSVHEEYCVDHVKGESRLMAMFPLEFNASKLFKLCVSFLLGVDVFALAATFIVYRFVPDTTQMSLNKKRRLSHTVLGMILLSYISSLIASYSLMITITNIDIEGGSTACTVLGVLMYFFFTATFFWLSALYFEIYWTTRYKRICGTKRFRLYSIYAWLGPLVMSLACVVIDLTPGIGCSVVKPRIGIRRCFFETKQAQLMYFYTPTGVILVICVGLYILIVRNIYRTKTDSPSSNSGVSGQIRNQSRQRQILIFKLLLIMGLAWFFEILECVVKLGVFSQLVVVVNAMQPLFVFVTFVMRPNIMEHIKMTLSRRNRK